jgi:hypothetical protein
VLLQAVAETVAAGICLQQPLVRGSTVGRELPQPARLTEHGVAIGGQSIEMDLDVIGFEAGELAEAINLYKALDLQGVMNNETRVGNVRHVTDVTDPLRCQATCQASAPKAMASISSVVSAQSSN